MDFANVVRVFLRRWLILLVGLALAVGAAFAAYRLTPRNYVAVSQVMVLLSPTASNPELETSPFLYLPDGLSALARVLTLTPNTPEYRADMAAQGFETGYTVSLEAREPIVVFTVEGSDPEDALRTRDELMARFSADLDRVQREEGVPDRQWAHPRVLEASDTPSADSGDAFKAAAAVGALGVLLTLLVIALLERGYGVGALLDNGSRIGALLERRWSGAAPRADSRQRQHALRSDAMPAETVEPGPGDSPSRMRDPVYASED